MARLSASAPWAFSFMASLSFLGLAAPGALRGDGASLSGVAAFMVGAMAALSLAARLRSVL